MENTVSMLLTNESIEDLLEQTTAQGNCQNFVIATKFSNLQLPHIASFCCNFYTLAIQSNNSISNMVFTAAQTTAFFT